ncbi:MAG: cysteine desulfurase [Clostridia bacterium]|nr:cysteine desulfurase [Clostridia bacterium]
MIYLDNAATTKMCEAAVNAYINAPFGNPSSLHGLGIRAEGEIKAVREKLAAKLGANREEIIFTSGGSESNNTAILGAARAKVRRGKHVITTGVEHASVLETCKVLEREGFEVTYLAPDEITISGVLKYLRDDTVLVSVMAVNNEVGAIYPIGEIAKAVKGKNPDIIFHTDAVQAFGKIPLNLREGKVDLLSLSAHKIHGPKGVGALYIRKGVRVLPLVNGGGQEKGLRSGTENVPGILAFGATLDFEQMNNGLINRLKDGLAGVSGIHILREPEAPHILSISIPKYPSEVLMRILEDKGIYVSSGSACSKGKRSYVLTAYKVNPKLIDSAIRVSISKDTTEAEIYEFINTVKELFG